MNLTAEALPTNTMTYEIEPDPTSAMGAADPPAEGQEHVVWPIQASRIAEHPEVLLPIMRSVQAVAGNGSNGLPELLGLGGNASIATIGYAMASCVSCPTVMYDVLAIVFHSVIR